MPDLSNSYRGGPSDVGSLATSSTGISITANATLNVKATSWTELIASTTHETTWVQVTLNDAASASTFLVDIGVGAAAAEQVLIPDLLMRVASAAQPLVPVYLLPLAIPKGTRISARCQASTGSGTVRVGIQCFSGPITGQHGLRRVETAGITTATSRVTQLTDSGATPHTDGATWVQLIAATTFHWRWLCAAIANHSDVATAAVISYLVDLGVGASSSETAFVNDLWFLSHTGADNPIPSTYCFPCAIASGTRISARYRESTGTAGDRALWIGLYGVG